jgi:hypothetical protein
MSHVLVEAERNIRNAAALHNATSHAEGISPPRDFLRVVDAVRLKRFEALRQKPMLSAG